MGTLMLHQFFQLVKERLPSLLSEKDHISLRNETVSLKKKKKKSVYQLFPQFYTLSSFSNCKFLKTNFIRV